MHWRRKTRQRGALHLPETRDQLAAPTVQRIAHQRMADVRQVHAYLVRAPGLEDHAQQRVAREALLDAGSA